MFLFGYEIKYDAHYCQSADRESNFFEWEMGVAGVLSLDRFVSHDSYGQKNSADNYPKDQFIDSEVKIADVFIARVSDNPLVVERNKDESVSDESYKNLPAYKFDILLV